MTLKERTYRLLLNLRQRSYRLLCVLTVWLATVFGLNLSVFAEVAYVDGTVAACDNEGDSWAAAFKYLQDALGFASNPTNNITEIWCAAGTYYVDQDCANPNGDGDRTRTFQLVKEVFLLGGFDGTESFASERD